MSEIVERLLAAQKFALSLRPKVAYFGIDGKAYREEYPAVEAPK